MRQAGKALKRSLTRNWGQELGSKELEELGSSWLLHNTFDYPLNLSAKAFICLFSCPDLVRDKTPRPACPRNKILGSYFINLASLPYFW